MQILAANDMRPTEENGKVMNLSIVKNYLDEHSTKENHDSGEDNSTLFKTVGHS